MMRKAARKFTKSAFERCGKAHSRSATALPALLAALAAALATPPALARAPTAAPTPIQPAAPAALASDETSRIEAAVAKVLAETQVPAVQIAVVRDGRIVLSRAWGQASKALGPARADQPFQVASNSKQFLGALLLLLEAEGRLNLNDSVQKWVPSVTGADGMTVRQLLTHTSGLQDYWPQDYLFTAMTRPTTPDGIVARWGRQALDYAPGAAWQYSNTGYVVAGLIAEKAGGKPLWTQYEERFFRPLGMRVVSQDDAVGPRYPAGHHRAALGPVREASPPARGWLWAAGEFAMPAEALARWNLARLERSLMPPALWAAQETPAVLTDGTVTSYGLGVGVGQRRGRRTISHTGGAVGFFSRNTVWPDERVAVTVLTNGDFSNASTQLTDLVAEIVLPQPAADPAKALAEKRTADARARVTELLAGRLTPARFTDNARFYFTPRVLADYRDSLAPLGTLTGIAPLGAPSLRGGFVQQAYALSFGERTLTLSTFAEPGRDGRWEQFLIGE